MVREPPLTIFTFFLYFPYFLPPSQHGEEIKGFRSTLLYRHRHAKHHPAGWLIRGDADRLVGGNTRQQKHKEKVPLCFFQINKKSKKKMISGTDP